MTTRRQFVALCAVALAAACSDATQPVAPVPSPNVLSAAKTPNAEKLVAIGTSISMGWASNGVYAGSQMFAWPELMRFGGGGPISLPLIQSPGCTSPLVAPLGANMRLSGEDFSGSTVCAANERNVQLPTQDVAFAGALASYALAVTPEIADGAAPWVARVLPPGTTQVEAALSQTPTLVSVELGGNDILQGLSGLLVPNLTFTPLPDFESALGAVLDEVGSAGPKGLVLGMSSDGTNLPALRRGDEIWADRAEFAALHVDVSADCEGSPNYINVSEKSLILVFTAAYNYANGLSNPVYSCADVPFTVDFVLTPADITFINGMLVQMRAFAQQEATTRGYAFFSIGELYDRPDLKPPLYSIISQLTSRHPYGPYISLDAVHPSPLGHVVLASAAVDALNQTYPGLATRPVAVPPGLSFSDQLAEPTTPAMALDLAKRIVREHASAKPLSCSPMSNCFGSFTRILR